MLVSCLAYPWYFSLCCKRKCVKVAVAAAAAAIWVRKSLHTETVKGIYSSVNPFAQPGSSSLFFASSGSNSSSCCCPCAYFWSCLSFLLGNAGYCKCSQLPMWVSIAFALNEHKLCTERHQAHLRQQRQQQQQHSSGNFAATFACRIKS